MKRSTPRNEFTDALNLSGLSFAEAAELLDRHPGTLQAYALGTRRTPTELVSRLSTHGWDAIHTDLPTDRYGVPFLEGSLSMRRATRHPSIAHGFDAIREAMARNPMPDPDAQPFVALDDMPDDEGADRADASGRPTNERKPRRKR